MAKSAFANLLPGIVRVTVMSMLTRPNPTEYAEFYKNYIARVPEGPVLDFLAKQLGDYRQLLVGVSDEAATAAPAPGQVVIRA